MGVISYIVNKVLKVEDVSENAHGVDVQGIDTAELDRKGEYMPTKLVEYPDRLERAYKREAYDRVDEKQVRDTEMRFDNNAVIRTERFKDFTFIISNTTDVDFMVWLAPRGQNKSVYVHKPDDESDISYRTMGNKENNMSYKVLAGSRNVNIKEIPLTINNTDPDNERIPLYPIILKDLAYDNLSIHYQAINQPTSGYIDIKLVGEPF